MLIEQYHHGDVFSRQVDLAYDSIPPLGLSLRSPIKFIQRSLWWCLGQQYINRKEKFLPFFCNTISSPISSNILQNNTKMLEEQWWEMQYKHEKEQQLLVYLEEAAEAHCIECAAQKTRKEAEAKVREKAKKWRLVEKKKKKRRLKYIQQLQNKVLAKDTILKKRAEESQNTGSKHKEVTLRNKKETWPSKKAKGKKSAKYCMDARVKIEVANPYEKCVYTR